MPPFVLTPEPGSRTLRPNEFRVTTCFGFGPRHEQSPRRLQQNDAGQLYEWKKPFRGTARLFSMNP